MTKAQAQILELFQALSEEEKRELAEQLVEQTLRGFYERMTSEQRAQLQDGIGQADRGEVVDSEAAFDRIARQLNFRREQR
jgi:hypothetical protein